MAIIIGDDSNNTLTGGINDDDILAKGGNDIVYGGPGNDTLTGWYGDDTMDGGAGDDYLVGSFGHDSLEGGGGHDSLVGLEGNDVLSASLTGEPEQCYWEVGLLKRRAASAREREARTADSHNVRPNHSDSL